MSIAREALDLKYQTKSESDYIPVVLIYNPYLKSINKIAKNLQPLLNKDSILILSSLFPHLYHIVKLLTSNFYLHLPLYQIKFLSRAPFPTSLSNAISVPI